ncbi:hypothetical protein [Crossiella sp. NPDC003009]
MQAETKQETQENGGYDLAEATRRRVITEVLALRNRRELGTQHAGPQDLGR